MSKKNDKKYEKPEIVYEGKITTRAGSPPGNPGDDVDPAKLFGNN